MIKAIAIAVIAAAVAGLIGAIAYGFDQRGYQRAEAKWLAKEVARKDAEMIAIHDRLAENEQIKAQHELDKQRLKKGYADEIALSRARSAAAPGLRVGTAICPELAAQAQADGTGGSDGGGAAPRLVPPAVDADFRALELRVEEIFAGCRVAQKFIADNGMAP